MSAHKLAEAGMRVTALPRMPEALAAGLCTTGRYDPDIWTGTGRAAGRAEAIRICQRCPVIAACHEWSLSLPVADKGVWGGLSAAQRVAAKRERSSP